ncbi:hypothetical protein JVU11DRAFT_10709 [Chiua virens]|nr:hypothetical protein JVU11DRAFT_10709 [Chiua virens]
MPCSFHEISREICALLDQSSLPVVARTCRALLDPALDELWRDLYNIFPFIHLLTLAQPGESYQASLHSWPVVTNSNTTSPIGSGRLLFGIRVPNNGRPYASIQHGRGHSTCA